jgi:integrase
VLVSLGLAPSRPSAWPQWVVGERALIRFRRAKGDKTLDVALQPETRAALSAYLECGRPALLDPSPADPGSTDDPGWVFLSHRAGEPRPLTMNALSLMLTRRYHAGGGSLRTFGSHRIRHATATLNVNNGVPLEEVRRLLSVVPDTVRGRRDRAILVVLVLTGRRRAEVIGLRAGDLSLEGETVFYSYRGKGGKRGRRELPRPAFEAIRATLADCGKELASMAPDESLWQAGAGPQGISSGTFYGRFRRYLQAAGLTPTGLHVLRHTAAKLRRDAGASIEAVSAFLDHSSLTVTTVYLRRLEGETDRTWPDVAVAIGV